MEPATESGSDEEGVNAAFQLALLREVVGRKDGEIERLHTALSAARKEVALREAEADTHATALAAACALADQQEQRILDLELEAEAAALNAHEGGGGEEEEEAYGKAEVLEAKVRFLAETLAVLPESEREMRERLEGEVEALAGEVEGLGAAEEGVRGRIRAAAAGRVVEALGVLMGVLHQCQVTQSREHRGEMHRLERIKQELEAEMAALHDASNDFEADDIVVHALAVADEVQVHARMVVDAMQSAEGEGGEGVGKMEELVAQVSSLSMANAAVMDAMRVAQKERSEAEAALAESERARAAYQASASRQIRDAKALHAEDVQSMQQRMQQLQQRTQEVTQGEVQRIQGEMQRVQGELRRVQEELERARKEKEDAVAQATAARAMAAATAATAAAVSSQREEEERTSSGQRSPGASRSGHEGEEEMEKLKSSNAVYRKELVEAAKELRTLRQLRDSLDEFGGLSLSPEGVYELKKEAFESPDGQQGDIGSSMYVVRMSGTPLSSPDPVENAMDAEARARLMTVPGKLDYSHRLTREQLESHVRLWEKVGAELVAENGARAAALRKVEDVNYSLRTALDDALTLLEMEQAGRVAGPAMMGGREDAADVAAVAERIRASMALARKQEDAALAALNRKLAQTNAFLQEALENARENVQQLLDEKQGLKKALLVMREEYFAVAGRSPPSSSSGAGVVITETPATPVPRRRSTGGGGARRASAHSFGAAFSCSDSDDDGDANNTRRRSTTRTARNGSPAAVIEVPVETEASISHSLESEGDVSRSRSRSPPRMRRRRFSVSFDSSEATARVVELPAPGAVSHRSPLSRTVTLSPHGTPPPLRREKTHH